MTHRFEGSCNTNILKWKLYRKINSIRTSHQTFVLMKTSWRRLEDVFRLRLQRTSWRRLEDVLIKTNIFALAIRYQKTSSRSLQDVLVKTNVFVLAIRPQDVFKTFSRRLARRLQYVFKRSCKNVFKTSSRRLQDVLKTSWRRLGKICLRRFNMFKLFLLTSLRDVVNTLLRRTAKTVIYRRICVVHTSEKLTVSVQNLQVR